MKYYYSPGTCSLAGHILLEELTASYEGILIDLSSGQHRKSEFLAINPAGAVPALVLDDGQVITQNIAILLYLGEQHPPAKLIPPAGSLERGRCYEWLAFLTSDVHKGFNPLFAPTKFVKSDAAKAELTELTRKRIEDLFKLMDEKLAGKTFVLGDAFSICDPYFYIMTRWAKHHKFNITQWPNVMQIADRIEYRPAVQATLKVEGLIKD